MGGQEVVARPIAIQARSGAAGKSLSGEVWKALPAVRERAARRSRRSSRGRQRIKGALGGV